jgi:hypothetical protein
MKTDIANNRRQELRDALRRFIDLALEQKVDAVSIGGDLYEHERSTLDTGHFLRQQLERLAPITAFIAPGNHDPYVPESLYRQIEWSPNVTIFSEPAFQPVPLSDEVTLWGAGTPTPYPRVSPPTPPSSLLTSALPAPTSPSWATITRPASHPVMTPPSPTQAPPNP